MAWWCTCLLLIVVFFWLVAFGEFSKQQPPSSPPVVAPPAVPPAAPTLCQHDDDLRRENALLRRMLAETERADPPPAQPTDDRPLDPVTGWAADQTEAAMRVMRLLAPSVSSLDEIERPLEARAVRRKVRDGLLAVFGTDEIARVAGLVRAEEERNHDHYSAWAAENPVLNWLYYFLVFDS
jgi:hypothetical protein